jgi:hypothetical protein
MNIFQAENNQHLSLDTFTDNSSKFLQLKNPSFAVLITWILLQKYSKSNFNLCHKPITSWFQFSQIWGVIPPTRFSLYHFDMSLLFSKNFLTSWQLNPITKYICTCTRTSWPSRESWVLLLGNGFRS